MSDCTGQSKDRNVRMQEWARIAAIPVLVSCIALIPRLIWAGYPHPPLFSDPEDYHNCAVGLLQGQGMSQEGIYRAYRPPLYPLFLATIYFAAGPNERTVYYVQAILGAVSCGLLALLVQRLIHEGDIHGPRWWPPLLAGLGLALFGQHVFFVGVLMTEVLFVFLLLIWLLCLTCSMKLDKRFIIAAGVLHGLLALCRPVSLAYLPVPIIYLFLSGKNQAAERAPTVRWIGVFLYCAMMVLTILPWTLRNALVLGRFVPISTNGGVNFYIGNHPGYGYWSTGQKEAIRAATDLDEVDEQALFYQEGLRFIRSEPTQAMKNAVLKFRYLFSQVPPWPWGERGIQVRFERLWPLTFVGWGYILGVLTLLSLPWLCMGRHRSLLPLVGVLLCHVGSVLIFFARTRFRLPMDPILLVLATGVLAAIVQAAVQKGSDPNSTHNTQV